MTEFEEKAEEYFSHHKYALHNRYGVQKDIHRMIYKDGYAQGQKDFDKDVEKLLNSYEIKYIDCNSIGGLIAFHQIYVELQKENAEFSKALEESEIREKELCILAENLKAELKKLRKCSRCMSNGKDINEMPCKNCLKNGVYTNWH